MIRRRPRPVSSEPGPELPEDIPSILADRPTPGTPFRLADLKINSPTDDTPSPLRDLESGWKETRRRHLSDTPIINKRNNVRFAITSSSSALLTPPTTPPTSPRLDAAEPEPKAASSTQKGNGKIDEERREKSISAQACSDHPSTNIRPILSYPLPPTSRPIPLIKGKKDTIIVGLPGSAYELILILVGGKVIKIRRGGYVAEFGTGKGKDAELVLNLDNAQMWNEQDKRDWKNVGDVVEGFKCITPRVKMYLPLGQLTITCSQPPNIILNFQLGSDSGNVPSHTNIGVNVDSLNEQAGSIHHRSKIRVRVAYSRCSREMKIDTAYTFDRQQGRREERLRTRRVIPLDDHSRHQEQRNSKPTDQIDSNSNLKRISREVGLNVTSELDQWRVEEKEGLRRLWALRCEWVRWDET